MPTPDGHLDLTVECAAADVLNALATYGLCVAATSWGAAAHQYTRRCVPLEPVSYSARVVA